MELNSLSARAVNVLGRHGIRTREQARQANVLALLSGERNCGRKTMDEIARVDPSGDFDYGRVLERHNQLRSALFMRPDSGIGNGAARGNIHTGELP